MSYHFNLALGQKIRHERKLRGITQAALGAMLGISFQQVQKYETGLNTLSFERVLRLSEILEVPLMEWAGTEGPSLAPMQRQELNLLRAYHNIENSDHKTLLCALARALSPQP